MKDLILAIDCGTQSIRAILYDLEGNVFAQSSVPITPFFSVKPGWAEQEADYFWFKICLACQTLWKNSQIDKESIRGVSVTTQRSTMVNVDVKGRPLRPAIIWMDDRKTEGLKPLPFHWNFLFHALGHSRVIAYFRNNIKANWISINQPDVWKATHKYLFLSGFFNYRLCGRFVDSVANQVGYVPFSYKHQKWEHPWSWKWDLSPLTRDMLPELVPSSHILGEITPEAASQTGIPAGIPLVATAGDKSCETLGVGCLHLNQGAISLGTAATINVTGDKFYEFPGHLPSYPAAIPHLYNYEYMLKNGYWLITWFKEQLSPQEIEKSKLMGVSVEMLFEDLIKEIPPGNVGLIFLPYLLPGVGMTHFHAKGTIIGIGNVHTKAHLYRGMIEGIIYDLKLGKENIEKYTKTPLTSIVVSGGGSRSDTTMQIIADIFGIPASRTHTVDASSLGSAIDVAVGLKLYPDFETAVQKMVRIRDVFEPNPEAQEIYLQLYERVYKKIYPQLKGLFDEIQKITNYPEY